MYCWYVCICYSCPRVASPSVHPKPKPFTGKQLGGVDQASLRQSISRHSNSGGNIEMEYLSDLELWAFTDTVRQLEALQLSIVRSGAQVQCVLYACVAGNH